MRLLYRVAIGQFTSFKPSDLVLGYWTGPNYAGLNRAMLASAGNSGSKVERLSLYGNSVAPVAGRVLNGFTSERYTSGAKGASAFASTAIMGPTTGTILALIYAESAAAGNATDPYMEQTIYGEGSGYGHQLTFSASGVKLSTFNGANWTSFAVACAIGGWHSVVARVNGGVADIFLDNVKHTYGGVWPGIGTRGTPSVGGIVYNGATTTDLNSMELAAATAALSDDTINLWNTSYLHGKYPSGPV